MKMYRDNENLMAASASGRIDNGMPMENAVAMLVTA
jgi:hypothetical protein